jgi:hypothetical protein
MKKVLAALLVGLLSLALSGVAGAAPDEAAVDIAKGKGTDSEGGTFQFSAIDLDGDAFIDSAATGHVSYELGSSFFKGQVTCLKAGGGFTTLAGPIEKTNLPLGEGAGFHIIVLDGEPFGEPDAFRRTIFPGTQSPDCGIFFLPQPIVEGDIVVIDARPLA